MTTFTATKVTVLVMNALFMLMRKVYPYTAVQFVQLLAVNYLKFKVTSLTAMADLQISVIIVILLSTTKTRLTNTSENNTCYLFLTTRELSIQLCINRDNQGQQQQQQQQQRGTLTESAFRKSLQFYRIVDSNNTVGLLDFMTAQRDEISDIIEQKTLNEGPQKVQFSAKLSLHKEARDNGEASDIDIYANSEMTPVHHRLSNETFFHMMEKMLTVLFVLASNGSGWILQKILWVDLKFAKFSPICGSSFIELPLCLRNQRYLLNIRNHDDFECFNYCYTAWNHELLGPNLADPSRDIRTQLTNLATYRKPEATKPRGEFSMPMGFHDVHQFEIMNDVQVNVFHFSKGDLLPMYLSNNRNSFSI